MKPSTPGFYWNRYPDGKWHPVEVYGYSNELWVAACGNDEDSQLSMERDEDWGPKIIVPAELK